MNRDADAPKRPDWALVLVLAVVVLWGAAFIARTTFVAEGRRVFCLFDDAMISMTYARNLLEGHGLEWSRRGTPPVEGFSHPLWLAPMIVANLAPVPLETRSLAIQLLSLALLALVVAEVRRLTRLSFTVGEARHWWSGALFSGLYYPLAFWSLRGFETAAQALLSLVAVRLALEAVHGGRDRHLPLWLVSTAAVLLRMDLALLVGVVHAYLVLGGGLRPAGRRSWWIGLGVCGAAALGYEAFRWFYFHDWLPNTYYLKLAGAPLLVRALRGRHFLAQWGLAHAVFLALTAGGAAWFARRTRSRAWLLPAGVIATAAAYNVYVGADAWDGANGIEANRFLAWAMPLLFVLWNGGLNAASDALQRPARRRLLVAAAALIAAFDLGAAAWRRNLLLEAPPGVSVTGFVYRTVLELEARLAAPALVAVVWAGVPAYFTDYRLIDILGYNDREVARGPHRIGTDPDHFRAFLPGHTKWDFARVFAEHPDAVQSFVEFPVLAQTGRWMRAGGYERCGTHWCRSDSPYLVAAASAAAP